MKIGYIIGTYPLVTTTFIDREIAGLRERGLEIALVSIRRPPPEVERMEEYRQVRQNIVYLFPVAWLMFLFAHVYYAVLRPRAYWGLLAYLVSRPHLTLKQRGMTVLHFAEGVYAACLLRDAGCDHFHAHFADRAVTVALCVSRLSDRPYSLTAHANDLYASPLLLSEKIKNAQFAVTVSQFNREHILKNYPDLDPEKIVVLHPWVKLDEFVPPVTPPQNSRFQILSVGRLVEKKGHRYLIHACRLLWERGLDIDCRIVGSGPLEKELRTLITQQELDDCVRLEGAGSKAEVLRQLAKADVFVLASVIAPDGDRDGMPVALAEAMAMQLPVISTNIVGIGELVQPGTGYLVAPQDSVALGRAILAVYNMSRLGRAEMGKRGRAIVEMEFGVDQGIDTLAELFRRSTAPKQKFAFFVWGSPSVGPRSSVLARELGIPSLHFIRASVRRGVLSAPFRYIYQALETLRRLWRERPQIVFVQSPPSLAVLCVYLYCKLTSGRYLIDAHSAAMLQRVWRWPHWLHRLLVRGAIATIVTNEHFQDQIQADGGRALVIHDVPTDFDPAIYPLEGACRIAVVNTFQDDEPLEEILAAATQLPDIDFYITGKKQLAREEILASAPANAHFTGFLPESAYYGLIAGADAVMCLTTRDYTMQRGACEALSLGKPIITSDTELLKSYFSRGTIHVSNRCESIREGVAKMQADLRRYQIEILELRRERRREWQEKKQALIGLIRQ